MSMNVNNINQKQNQVPYTVNENGAIEIESLKNTSIYEVAQKYDNSGVDNELLEGEELTGFLREVLQDDVMKTCLDISEDPGKYVYYQQKDSQGNLLKKCIASKNNSNTMSFSFKDGQPKFCITCMPDGEKDIINLDTGRSTNFKTPKDKPRGFMLNAQNCKLLKRLALDKPPGGLSEVVYRISNWDWGNW